MIPPHESLVFVRGDSSGSAGCKVAGTIECSSAGGYISAETLPSRQTERRALGVTAIGSNLPAMRTPAFSTFRVKVESKFECILRLGGGANSSPCFSMNHFSLATTASACFFFSAFSRCRLPHEYFKIKPGSNFRQFLTTESPQREHFPISPCFSSVIHFLTMWL